MTDFRGSVMHERPRTTKEIRNVCDRSSTNRDAGAFGMSASEPVRYEDFIPGRYRRLAEHLTGEARQRWADASVEWVETTKHDHVEPDDTTLHLGRVPLDYEPQFWFKVPSLGLNPGPYTARQIRRIIAGAG